MSVHIAAIDVGSNAVRMVLGYCQQVSKMEGSLKLIRSWRSFLRLGEDVFQFGHITPNSLETLTDILKQYVNQFLDYPDVSLYIAATSAVRGAKNRQEVLQHVQKHAGIEIKILSGFEEADCMLNVLRNMKEWQSLEAGIKQMLLADLGGGSMEVTVVDASHILYQKSLEYGALRLAKLNTKAQQTALKMLYQEIREIREYTIRRQNEIPPQLVLTGGSAKVMARLIHGRLYPSQQLPTICTFSWEQFLETKIVICDQGTEQYISSEIRPDQAEIFIPALRVFELLCSIVLCKKISVPFIGLKEGLILQQAQRIYPKCSFLL